MTAPSGLRNPQRSARGVAAAALGAEGLVLLLAIVPLHALHVRLAGLAIGVVVALAVACFALAGLLRRAWAWSAGSFLQVILLASGFVFHLALTVVGVIFIAVWAYVLYVRRTVLSASDRAPR